MLHGDCKPLYLLLLAGIQILGIALFCKGFFPYKIYLPGFASSNEFLHNNNEPEFDRLVFIVIDALRNDFILGDDSGFDFVNSQIQRGQAYPFTAKATAPTVTMPRIKALTTGTIPSFLDAILNIAESDTTSSLDFHDNWVYQFKHDNNRTIHFFGDDTWIRLFPGLFTKTDGTTSFYVSDTVEVDTNVTRHIKTDLVDNDWDAVIFHYLGLDHIGHLGGPQSPLMKPKQKEMDNAIESIYDIVSKQDAERIMNNSSAKGTLIVVCGDHGMNEKGNHGGSSIGETSAALVFLSPRFESRPTASKNRGFSSYEQTVFGYPIVDQIDIVPTLATLFSFPIPKNSLGKIISDIFETDQVDSSLDRFQQNAYQLAQLLVELLPEFSNYLNDPIASFLDDDLPAGRYYAHAIQLHKTYQTIKTEKVGQEAIKAYIKFIDVAKSYLSNTASDYNLNLMITGVVLIGCSAVGFVAWTRQIVGQFDKMWNLSQNFGIFAVIAYSASMFSSSFVEEEHATWYYFLQTMILLCLVQSLHIPNQNIREKFYPISLCMVQLILVRVAIAWNQNMECLSTWPTIKWHLMAISLAVILSREIHILYKLEKIQSIDVNQTAKIIQTIIKTALILITTLIAVLVLVYKIKAEGLSEVPKIYQTFLDWELVQPLDQVQLGKLIYNYFGAGLFVLSGLFYVTKRASLMTIDVSLTEDKKTGVFLQLLLHLVTFLFVLLSDPQHAFLYVIFNIQLRTLLKWQEHVSKSRGIPTWLWSTIIGASTHAAFFLTGHTNSIASIDLSNAYVGVEDYDTLLIGLLTFCSNWSASLWWAVAGWALIEQEQDQSNEAWYTFIVTQSTLFSLVLALLSISVTILREHLFIWTVFSPKYLYQVAWTILFHWVAQAFLGSMITQYIFKWKLDFNEEQEVEDNDEYVDNGEGGISE